MRSGQQAQHTVADYLATPEGWRGELIEGRLVMAPSPSSYHQALVVRLLLCLGEFLDETQKHRLLVAPCDVVIGDANALQPDVLVLSADAVPPGPGTPHQTPIWIAEVLSPSTAHVDRFVKLPVYARGGVQEAWLIDPDCRTVEVHDLEMGDGTRDRGRSRVWTDSEVARSRVLTGLAVPLGGFFGPRAPRS